MEKMLEINIPGSKSYTNRALICAALREGKTKLLNYGECEDTYCMIEGLRKMGVKIKNAKVKNNEFLEIEGGMEKLRLPKGKIYVGNAGTTMRFLTTLAGLVVARKVGEVILTGSKRMQERPVQDLLDALSRLGIIGESVRGDGCPPIKFKNQNAKCKMTNQNAKLYRLGGRAQLKGEASSQYLSSILLCAPYFDKDTEIIIEGELTSKPYVDMTIDTMKAFGVKVMHKDYKVFKVKAGQKYKARDYVIEGDASSASYFIAGAALTGRSVVFPGLSVVSKQGDVKFREVLYLMQKSKIKMQNEKSKVKNDKLEFCGSGQLYGITIDMNSMPDMVPTLSVLAMFAKGKTVIKNVANLRIKESDRLRSLATEIKKFGILVQEKRDALEIAGNPKLLNNNVAMKQYNNIKIHTYGDHRMAMTFAVAKLVFPDIIIENPSCVAKSFPWFWKEWKKLAY